MSDKPQAIAPKAQPSAAAGTVISGDFFVYSCNKLVAQAPEEEAAFVAAAQAELK